MEHFAGRRRARVQAAILMARESKPPIKLKQSPSHASRFGFQARCTSGGDDGTVGG